MPAAIASSIAAGTSASGIASTARSTGSPAATRVGNAGSPWISAAFGLIGTMRPA